MHDIALVMYCEMSEERKRKRAVEGLLLTELELKVIDLLSKYEDVERVAEELKVKPITVRMTKTRVTKRLNKMIESIRIAIDRGLIDPDEVLRRIFPTSLFYALKGLVEEKYSEKSVYEWLKRKLYEIVKEQL